MQSTLQNKIVMVTGSARRVGRGIALGFAAQGANVVIHHSNSPDQAEQTASEARSLGVEALVVQGDHARYADVEANFEAVQAAFGRVDVLVNSAAIFKQTDLLDVPPDEWDRVMNVNLRAPFWCTQFAGRLMRDAGIAGSIVNIADNSGLRPWATRPHHSISKAGVISLTEVTAAALAPYQIRANCLVLGPTLPTTGAEDAWQATVARLPLKRSGSVEQVAQAAIFLTLNDTITGAVLRVDSGEWLGDASED